ncbi:MAG TPA: hypothetical protein VF772_13300 [Terriglobales bacterium]
MDEGRKRVLAIVAGILVARHLKTKEALFTSNTEPKDGVAGCIGCSRAERIIKKVDGVYP